RDGRGPVEHLRAQERPAGSGGRQHLRARVGGRRRDRVRHHRHPPQRRRHRTVVRCAGCDVYPQRRAAFRLGDRHAGNRYDPDHHAADHAILVKDNVFDDIETARWGRLNYPGTGFLFYTGAANVTIDHNTLFNTGPAVYGDISANSGFVYRNNISPSNIGTADYQLCCSGVADNIDGIGGRGTTGNATVTLNTYLPAAVFVRNVLAGGWHATNWATENLLLTPPDTVGFRNR